MSNKTCFLLRIFSSSFVESKVRLRNGIRILKAYTKRLPAVEFVVFQSENIGRCIAFSAIV